MAFFRFISTNTLINKNKKSHQFHLKQSEQTLLLRLSTKRSYIKIS
jgi:hypothetical protein